MKKIYITLVLFVFFSVSAFAFDFSLGGNAQLGFSVLRGSDYTEFSKDFEKEPTGSISAGIDTILAFTPNIALETGVGYNMSTQILSSGSVNGTSYEELLLSRIELMIPLMVRFQKEYALGSIGGSSYISAGARLGFNLFFSNDNVGYITDTVNNTVIYTGTLQANDISMAIGQEFRLGKSNYIGLRLQYNVNYLTPMELRLETALDNRHEEEWYHDSIEISLTYRYVFGR